MSFYLKNFHKWANERKIEKNKLTANRLKLTKRLFHIIIILADKFNKQNC